MEPLGGLVITQAGAAFDAFAPTVDKVLADTFGMRTGLSQI